MASICVVEDEPALLQLIKEELEDLGHKVLTAPDGEKGAELIMRTRPDLVVSDINMPRMNGYQMLARLKSEMDGIEDIPFLYLSAYADKNDIADGMMTGATAYITKPVDMDALTAWVDSLIANRSA